MKAVGLLLPALLALAPATYAAPAPQPAHISVRYQGSLRDALEKVAAEGNINLVAVGNLDIPAQVVLHDVTPEQAIDTIAKAYHLTVNKDGSIWTVAGPGAPGTAVVPVPTPTPAPQAQPAPQAPQAQAKSDEEKEDQDSMQEEKDSDEDSDEQAQAMPGVKIPGVPMPPLPPMPPRIHIRGNAISGTGSQTVEEGQTVHDAVAYGGTLTVNGHVTGDAVAFGGNVEVGPKGRIDGDASAFGGVVTRAPGSYVGGAVASFGGNGMSSVVAHGISHSIVDHSDEVDSESHNHGMSRLAGLLLQFILYFGCGFLILMFAPGAMKKVSQEINRDPLRSGITGLVAVVALLVLSPLLIISVVGILALIPLWLAAVVAVMMGFTAVAQEIGMRIPAFRGRKTQALVLALGVLILLAVEVVPVLNWLTLGVLACIGFGAVTRTRFGTRPKGFPEPA